MGINNNLLHLCWKLLLATAMLMICIHLFTCLWYTIGNYKCDGWTSYDEYHLKSLSGNLAYKVADDHGLGAAFWYVASARWVVSQLNGRTDMDARRNMLERGFTVCVGIFLSVVFQAVFIAHITQAMLDINDMFKDRKMRELLLNEYLSRYRLPVVLVRQVKYYARDYSDLCRERLKEEQVIALLPVHMQSVLLFEIRSFFILGHSLFRHIVDASDHTARELCRAVLRPAHFMMFQVVFSKGDVCNCMRFMDTGIIEYGRLRKPKEDASNSSSDGLCELGNDVVLTEEVRLQQGAWLCEPALWVTWLTCGTCVSYRTSSMIEIYCQTLGEVLRKSPDLHAVVVIYAKNFRTAIQSSSLNTDLHSIDIEIEMVVQDLVTKSSENKPFWRKSSVRSDNSV